MPKPRSVLEQYVAGGKLMQVATLCPDGSPSVCNVWYACQFTPDLLRFISRPDRNHSVNIRRDGRVAGSIIAIELDGLGQTVQGVTYRGLARELPTTGIDQEVGRFLARWPAATGAIAPDVLARKATASRLYEIAVHEWILFDEVNFPDLPRQVIEAPTGSQRAITVEGSNP